MFYGTQRAEIPVHPLPKYDRKKSLTWHLLAYGVTFFDFHSGRTITLCDLPGSAHTHWIPYEYATCYEWNRAERIV